MAIILTARAADPSPTKISVGIWASDISKIDSATQTFTASLFVSMRWHDARLAHAGPGVKTCSLADIWHPELLVANDDGSSIIAPATINLPTI